MSPANTPLDHERVAGHAPCPLCAAAAGLHARIAGVGYYECGACDFIFAEPALLQRLDAGETLLPSTAAHGEDEQSARHRAYGSSLARVAEAVVYCTIPVHRFVDIGTGSGYLLDALSTYLPSHRHRFYGVEKCPPPPGERSAHENYFCGDLRQLGLSFECGTCIEVLEHLTPRMAADLADAMAAASGPGSLFLFATGLTDYVRDEDPEYLDPYRRGHITCWSVTAAKAIFEPKGFVVQALPGKTWAFLVERPRGTAPCLPVRRRLWHILEHNRELLTDPAMGEVLFLLGLESARAY